MSLGLIKNKYRRSKYGAATARIQGDLTTLMVGLTDRMIEAAMTLRRAEERLAGGDPTAAAADFGAASTGFARAAAFANSLPDAISNFVNQVVISSGSNIKFGLTTGFTFTGAPPETVTITETGMTWVTANTVVIVFPPPPQTSAVEILSCQATNYVAGDGFDIDLSTNTSITGTYDVYWIGFPDGVNT